MPQDFEPVSEYDGFLSHLRTTFLERYKDRTSPRVRMVGIVFARPNSPLSKSEIIPQINDWHFRSGDHIDFYFVGYARGQPQPMQGYIEVPIPGGDPWFYSAERFNLFRQEVEHRTSWQYGGGCELLLTNVRREARSLAPLPDFKSTVCCRLDLMKNDQAIQSVERFFESVFRFAESANDEDPTWGFSDSQGIAVAGSALKRAVLSLLPKALEAEYRKAEHFAVRNVAP